LQLKDYYTILELSPSASLDEIKKAYRRLAHQYHPDKNNNDPYAAAQFAEIKEAYETLTNPVKKDHYLQLRWYAQSTGKRKNQAIVNPVTVLKQLLDLDRYTHTLDEHRMDKPGLYDYMCNIFSDETITKLNGFNEPGINKEIVLVALRSAQLLPLPLAQELTVRLRTISTADDSVNEAIAGFLTHKKQIYYWEKRRIWVIIGIVILLCACMLWASGF
jgi:molecular chaperone DnaJ